MSAKMTDMCRFVAQPGSEVSGSRYRYWFSARLTEVPDEAFEWCLEQFGIIGPRWRYASPDGAGAARWYDFYFRDQGDAFLFKVRWC